MCAHAFCGTAPHSPVIASCREIVGTPAFAMTAAAWVLSWTTVASVAALQSIGLVLCHSKSDQNQSKIDQNQSKSHNIIII